MEEEDIAALLERELDLLDDAEEDFELGLNLLTEETAGNDIESEIQNELQELFVSANDLQHFATGGSESLRTTIHDNEQLEVDREIIPEAPIIPSDSSNYAYIDPQLTEEEFLILKELMELMVESVERCAPICARTEITPMVIRSADIPTLTAIPLQLITEDSDVQISSRDIPQDLPVPESSNISGLWSDKLSAEAQLVKEQRIQSAQESDRVMWDEANRFKQEMEQERLRREERRQTREAAKRAAIMDKSAVRFESL